MLKLYALFTAVLFAGLALAADPAPDPAAAPGGHPPGCPMMKQAQGESAPGMMAEHKGMGMEGKGMRCGPRGEGRGLCAHCPLGKGSRGWACGPLGCCSTCCVLTVLAVVLLINLLLTILVVRDMSARGKVNGLWVPLLLIAGIPVTALYALFRIGDNLKALEEKRV